MAANAQGGASRPDLVVLVHGIRTHKPWYIPIRDELTSAGFAVEPTNYGRFGTFRFLAPVPFFKAWAAYEVERDIRDAMQKHDVQSVSVIAHSFGTYVVARILKKRSDIAFRHIIFCGSVVKFRFPFQLHYTRFMDSVVNEVGTRDIWPIVAESVTWGYGATGAFGFSRPRVFDRYHRGLSHSAFLNPEFCRRWWIPVLQGATPQSHDEAEAPPWWLRLLSVFQIKLVAILLLASATFFVKCRAPERNVTISKGQYFVGEMIGRLVAEAAQPHSRWCGAFISGRRRMRSTGVQDAAESLVVCQTTADLTYRDPTTALQALADKIPCLEVSGVAQGDLRVGVNRTLGKERVTNTGKSLWLCGCDEAEIEAVLRIVNK